MGYKLKPNKGISKRMRVSKTGKLKHNHEKTSHLRSGRSPATKRKLGRASVICETQGKRLRDLLHISGKKPARTAHLRALKNKAAAEAAAAPEAVAAK